MRNLIFILTLAILLRFYQLGANPPSINWDEASNGYNAYSILKTGRDEYGNFLPLYNRSFDDYKPPLYMYLNVVSVKLVGLNELGARLPSATLGSLTILVVYLIVLRITASKKISHVAAFFGAVSPWTVHFSRVGFESNIGLFFGLAAFTALLWALPLRAEGVRKRNVIILLLSSLIFGLSFYSYHSARIFVPIMFIVTMLIFKDNFLKLPRKYIFLFFAITLIVITPFFLTSPKDAIGGRYKTVSLGAQKESTDDYIKYVNQDNNTWYAKYLHQRRILILRIYLNNYLSHFNPEFLFVVGDRNLRHHTEGFAMFPLIFLPLFMIGLYKLIEKNGKRNNFILAWLLIAPLPAMPADAAPHAVRSVFMTLPIILISSVGVKMFLNLFRTKAVLIVLLVCILAFYLYGYLHNYYFHYNRDKAEFWMYGFKEAVTESMKLTDQYPVINVDSSIEQGYIFWLFHNKYDPKTYQGNTNKPNIWNFSFNDDKVSEGELFISLADHFLPDLQVVHTIYYPNGEEAVKIGRRKFAWEK